MLISNCCQVAAWKDHSKWWMKCAFKSPSQLKWFSYSSRHCINPYEKKPELSKIPYAPIYLIVTQSRSKCATVNGFRLEIDWFMTFQLKPDTHITECDRNFLVNLWISIRFGTEVKGTIFNWTAIFVKQSTPKQALDVITPMPVLVSTHSEYGIDRFKVGTVWIDTKNHEQKNTHSIWTQSRLIESVFCPRDSSRSHSVVELCSTLIFHDDRFDR